MRQLSDLAGLPPAVSGAAGVLVRSPGLHDRRNDVCATLSMAGNPAGVVAVTYRGPAREWLDRVQGHRGNPDSTRLVVVGDSLSDEVAAGATVVQLDNPGDLTGLEIAVSEQLAALPAGTGTLCFDSLTSLLQYADLEAAYRLLHLLIERLHAEGVVGHFHVDPAAHEESTLTALAGIFDAVVDCTDDGVEVRTTTGVGPDDDPDAA